MTVLAQQGPVERIEAKEFRLVDGEGRLLALMKAAPSNSGLTEAIVVPRPDQFREPQGGAIMLFDSEGKATWAAPEPIEPPARLRPLTKAK
jgi:hypothetical protein